MNSIPTGDLEIVKAVIKGCNVVAIPDENTIECTYNRADDIFTKRFGLLEDGKIAVTNLQYSLDGKLLHQALFALRPFDWDSALEFARQRI